VKDIDVLINELRPIFLKNGCVKEFNDIADFPRSINDKVSLLNMLWSKIVNPVSDGDEAKQLTPLAIDLINNMYQQTETILSLYVSCESFREMYDLTCNSNNSNGCLEEPLVFFAKNQAMFFEKIKNLPLAENEVNKAYVFSRFLLPYLKYRKNLDFKDYLAFLRDVKEFFEGIEPLQKNRFDLREIFTEIKETFLGKGALSIVDNSLNLSILIEHQPWILSLTDYWNFPAENMLPKESDSIGVALATKYCCNSPNNLKSLSLMGSRLRSIYPHIKNKERPIILLTVLELDPKVINSSLELCWFIAIGLYELHLNQIKTYNQQIAEVCFKLCDRKNDPRFYQCLAYIRYHVASELRDNTYLTIVMDRPKNWWSLPGKLSTTAERFYALKSNEGKIMAFSMETPIPSEQEIVDLWQRIMSRRNFYPKSYPFIFSSAVVSKDNSSDRIENTVEETKEFELKEIISSKI